MKRLKKVIMSIVCFVNVILCSNCIYAKYNYTTTLDAFYLNRDVSPITYQIQMLGETKNYTNQNILLNIIANKKIQAVDGFSLDDTGKILTKTITQNEAKTILLKDLSGNTQEATYSVQNIDKEPPQILGIDNGMTYHENKKVDYQDNVKIKDIIVDKYGNNLQWNSVDHFYDTDFKYGIDVTGNSIHTCIEEHPQNTKYYRYYINHQLKATVEEPEYTFKDLTYGTNYEITIQALDVNQNVLDSMTKTIKTKFFSKMETKKEGDDFYVTIYGIDPRAFVGYACLWNQDGPTQKVMYPQIDHNRNLQLHFNAYDVNGKKCTGYYYFHVQLFNNEHPEVNDIMVMNVIFDKYYQPSINKINPYELQQNGKYQIIVTDLAGNKTQKNCTIQK